jgi:hypothetical protein
VHSGRQHGPRHPRHHHVRDNGIEAARVVLKTSPCLRAVTCLDNAVARLLKRSDEDIPDRSVVIDQ